MMRGALVPHAPLLLEPFDGPETARAARRIRRAARALRLEGAPLVVVSPHGARSGVYGRVEGTLDGFGFPGLSLERPADEAAERLARRWRKPLLDGPVDHGVLVALRLVGGEAPVVAATIAEADTSDEALVVGAIDEAGALADALVDLDGRDRVLLTSANTSAALSPRAPLTERPEAIEAEAALVRALTDDAASLERHARRLALEGGSCAAAPLTVCARVLAGRRGSVRAHECPVGVGYAVVVWS